MDFGVPLTRSASKGANLGNSNKIANLMNGKRSDLLIKGIKPGKTTNNVNHITTKKRADHKRSEYEKHIDNPNHSINGKRTDNKLPGKRRSEHKKSVDNNLPDKKHLDIANLIKRHNVVDNPFTQYGVLPTQLKLRDNRKTNSDPTYLDKTSDTRKRKLVEPDDTKYNNKSISDRLVLRRNPLSARLQSTGTHYSIDLGSEKRGTISRSTSLAIETLRSESRRPLETRPKFANSDTLMDRLYGLTGNIFFDKDMNTANGFYRSGTNCTSLFSELERICNEPATSCGEFLSCGNSLNRSESLTESALCHEDRFSTSSRLRSTSCLEDDIWRVSTSSARRAMQYVNCNTSVAPYDLNDDFMLTDATDYAVLQTKYGKVIYSPKFKDEEYMYRFIIITKEAQNVIETMCSTKDYVSGFKGPGARMERYLNGYEITHNFGIPMSKGWEHYFYFKGGSREIILRKRL